MGGEVQFTIERARLFQIGKRFGQLTRAGKCGAVLGQRVGEIAHVIVNPRFQTRAGVGAQF
ncbi:MAG: hypothetical protein HDKAJFGB_01464 [Anaerolineae bacterium]|nr:hypothetical protein [Anaerolineae bacterium]